MNTLKGIYDNKNNSFDLIRFFLAYSILIFHSPTLFNSSDEFIRRYMGEIPLGELAVGGFCTKWFFYNSKFFKHKKFYPIYKKKIA